MEGDGYGFAVADEADVRAGHGQSLIGGGKIAVSVFFKYEFDLCDFGACAGNGPCAAHAVIAAAAGADSCGLCFLHRKGDIETNGNDDGQDGIHGSRDGAVMFFHESNCIKKRPCWHKVFFFETAKEEEK